MRFRDEKPAESLSMLIDPGFPMLPAASVVNHITDEMLAQAPFESQAIQQITRFLGEALMGDAILVAHNARFDISFLEQMLRWQEVGAKIRHADTLGLSRSLVFGLKN